MNRTYLVIQDDTFALISRKNYGTENRASEIQKANPGVSEPLTPGINVIIPIDTSAPVDTLPTANASDVNEVAIKVNNQRFRFWDSVKITRSIDTVSTVEFGAPFDADSPGFRETFRPFSFAPIEITVGGEPLFTGTMVSVLPTLENSKKILTVNGYSLPGVLNDCTPPAGMFSSGNSGLQFNGQNILDIAKALISPFGIKAIISDGIIPGPVFEREACGTGKKIFTFLTDLAKQRNLIMADTVLGELLFLQSASTGNPVAILRQGESPVLSVTPSFNPQDYYSHITGIAPVIVNLKGPQYTVKNSRLSGVVRPFTFTFPDTEDSNIAEAVSAKIGRMFGNMVWYSVTVNTWRDSQGNLWEPNSTVKLEAKDAMIYSLFEFEIRSVEYERTANSETAVLNLVIPGAFSGKIPEALPWDE